MKESIECLMIFEIIGRPKEFVKETIEKVVENIGKEKGIELKNSKIAEIKELESNLFGTFADVDIRIDNLERLFNLVFEYMPASIEIVSPSKLSMSINEINSFLAELGKKLHRYDAVTKTAIMEREILINKIKQYEPNFSISEILGKPDKEGEPVAS